MNRVDARGMFSEDSPCGESYCIDDGTNGSGSGGGLFGCVAISFGALPGGSPARLFTSVVLSEDLPKIEADPKCPLASIVGKFTDDPHSPTPVHDWFAFDVAILIDMVFATLNRAGVVPEIEDGFRTTAEQADRREKYPIAAALSWHEIGRAIDINKHDPNFPAIEQALLPRGFGTGDLSAISVILISLATKN